MNKLLWSGTNMDIHSSEYAKWVADVWRLNDARNKEIQAQKEKLYDHILREAYIHARARMF